MCSNVNTGREEALFKEGLYCVRKSTQYPDNGCGGDMEISHAMGFVVLEHFLRVRDSGGQERAGLPVEKHTGFYGLFALNPVAFLFSAAALRLLGE